MWIDGFRAVRQKPHFGFRAESQAARSPAVYLTSEALSFRRAPCRMWTTHTLLTVIDFMDDPVNVRLLAVTQVPQFASRPSGFRGCRTAMRKGRKHENRFLQTVTPARGRLGLGGVLFQEKGFKIVLSPEVPQMIRKHLAPDVDSFLADHGLDRSDIATWIMHTGGPKVLEATQESLALPPGALDVSWETLRRVGNLSSASVLLVLEEFMNRRRPAPGSYSILAAMGPGFCAELVLLRW